MRWARQVVHVAAKDARMARWPLVAYAALVVLNATGAGAGMGVWSDVPQLLVGLVLVAYVVQADSPLRDDAFWVSRPLSAGAVFGAKALVVAALVGIALLGETVTLIRYDVAGRELAGLLAAGALSSATFLGVALMAAALTRDLRSCAMALIVGQIGLLVAGSIVQYRLGPRAEDASVIATWVLLAGPLAIGGFQYVTGRRGRSLALVVPLVALALGVPLLSGSKPEQDVARSRVLPAEMRPDSFLAATFQLRAGRPGDLAIGLSGGSFQRQYVLTRGWVDVRMPDGSLRAARLPRTTLSRGVMPAPALAGTSWVGLGKGGYEGNPVWQFLSSSSDTNVLPAGAVALRVRGDIEALEPSVLLRMPLLTGESRAASGRRVKILGSMASPGGVLADLEVSRVDGDVKSSFATGAGFERVEYAIVDRARATAYPLMQAGGSGSSGLFPGSPSHFTIHLKPQSTFPEEARAAPPPTDPLELLLIDWRPIGSYPVSAEVRPRTQRGINAP